MSKAALSALAVAGALWDVDGRHKDSSGDLTMSYRNQYSGSPWQQGGPPFNVGSYNQNYGGYNDNYGVSMMNSAYRNQGGYGSGGYGGSGMGNMRNMGGGYGGPSPSRHYMNDRMGGRSLPRGQMARKRLPQRSPASGPRSKRPNIESDRRSSKSRRHLDSRGGSKGRHDRNDDDEDDTYNPEEPTEDISDAEYESFDFWKCSDDDGEAEAKEDSKQNGDQESTETAEGADKDKSAEDAAPKKLHLCYVCKVKCSSKEVLAKHNNSKTHTDKIEELLAIRREKKEGGDDKKDNDHDRKKSSRKPGNWCTVCECAFSDNFLAHRRTKEHRKKRDKKYPKCRPCRMGFSSSEEYRDHYKSEDHKQKSAEFHYLKSLASGSDEDEAAIEPVKIKEEEYEEVEKMEEDTEEKAEAKEGTEEEGTPEDQEKSEEGTEEKEKDSEEKKEEKEKKDVKKKPREPRSVGQSFVISVQGSYCKLCHKFFKYPEVAKFKHCRSIMHAEAFKKAMDEAIEQEEERQKLAEEQDKQDREAQEAAERAAEIASIERAARDAIRKEAAAKKAGNKKEQDVEMKDVSDEAAKPAEGKDEKAEDTTAEEVSTENGSKDDEKAEELVEVEEGKEEEVEEKKESESVKEDQPEEEQEEETKEVASSPATRRGRGRGRGRKRR